MSYDYDHQHTGCSYGNGRNWEMDRTYTVRGRALWSGVDEDGHRIWCCTEDHYGTRVKPTRNGFYSRNECINSFGTMLLESYIGPLNRGNGFYSHMRRR